MKISIGLVFITLLSSLCGAQTVLQGKVIDNDSIEIPSGYIVTFNNRSEKQIIEYTLIRDGKFSLTLKKKYPDSIFIESRASGFENKVLEYRFSDIIGKTTIHHLQLKRKVDSLQEIVISRELPKKVVIKKDTISYDISQIADLEDRKLKDVIDNIPYLEYNESTGAIKYKGKVIKTITINGNNLLDANYALVAKNLNVSMIDRLEAIDNYSDNPIIASYSNSDDKSLNVILKKNAYQLTAGLEGMAGTYNEEKVGGAMSSTPSVFNEYLTSFNYIGVNDISVNPSTININDITSSFEDLNSLSTIAPIFTSRSTSANVLGNNRSVINETGYVSGNANYQFSKGTSVKVNLDHLDDNHIIDRQDRTIFNVEDDIVNLLSSKTQYSPDFSSLRLEYRKLNSKDLLLFKSSAQRNESLRSSKLSRNNTDDFQLSEVQVFNSLATSIEYSRKIDLKNAIQLSGAVIFQNNTFNFSATPNFLTRDANRISDNQDYEIDKKSFVLNAIHYLKLGNDKILSSLSFKNRSEYFNSFLNLTDDNELNNNEIALENIDLSFNNSYSLKAGRFKFSAFSKVTFLDQNLKSDQILSKRSLHFLPRVQIQYNLKNSFLTFDTSRTLSRLRLQNSFGQNLINSENSIYSNIPSLDLITGTSYRIGFNTAGEDILLKSFNTYISYSRTKGLFLSRIAATEDVISSVNEFSKGLTENFQINSNFSRYWSVSKLRLEIAPYAIYSIQPIALNSNVTNDVASIVSGTSLNLRSSLLGWLRMSYEADLNYSISHLEDNSVELTGLDQHINVRITPTENLWFRLIYNVQIPNFNKDEYFTFLDAEISFKLIPKVKSYLIGQNLLNTRRITTNSINAFSRVISSQNVQPRYLGLRFEFDLL